MIQWHTGSHDSSASRYLKPLRATKLPVMIDVIIPAYNAAPYIEQSLASLIQQDDLISSVIVINDGSSDQTADLVAQFAISHPALNLKLITQVNAGLSAARNTGIRHSHASYIAFLDADDLWRPSKLIKQLEVFQRSLIPNLGVVYSAYELIDKDAQLLSSKDQLVIKPSMRGDVYQRLLRGNFISGSGSSVLIKRAALDAVGYFDESLRACEDWDLWLRLARYYQFDFVAQPLVLIRVHANNMQKDILRMLSAELMMLNKFTQQNESNSFLLWKLRTFLVNSCINAQTIPGFSECSPVLQAQLTGWRMHLATTLLRPAQFLAQIYLKHQQQ